MNRGSPEVTIIIPQFNAVELTVRCVESIRERETECWPIIVVDDGSGDAAKNRLRAGNFSETIIIEQDHTGVSAAWNRGANAAETGFLVFLNNDVVLRGPFVERLIAPLKGDAASISGAALRRETALPARMLSRLPTLHFLEGWCFAVSRECFQRLGGFDETMRVYWSDTDFQARAVRNETRHGTTLTRVPGLALDHIGHRTARGLKNRREIWRTDRAAFIEKWGSQDSGVRSRESGFGR